ncbi:hypothetical protein Mapa_000353 [Marchantia paleacea]|nr:hypothetical protein Mapa_000353 [Marchantia paleacea]
MLRMMKSPACAIIKIQYARMTTGVVNLVWFFNVMIAGSCHTMSSSVSIVSNWNP